MKPRARRTLTLIAKSLQTLANMASFGTKEHWMEPMNAFLTQHREGFKTFIDDMCYVPAPVSALSASATNSPPQYSPGVVTTETHLSYTTPMTIMQRLPPTSREGFPSLPYLIDQARAFADLVQLWLDSINPSPPSALVAPGSAKRHSEMLQAIRESGDDLRLFHDICSNLNTRTQECLSRAERAERSHSAMDFRWDDLIHQLHHSHENAESSDEMATQTSIDLLADKLASDASILPPGMDGREPPTVPPRPWETMNMTDEEDEGHATPFYTPTTPHAMSTPRTYETTAAQTRPGSSGMTMHMAASSIQNSFRRALASRGSETRDSPSHSASASASNLSSAVSSDAEHTNGVHAHPPNNSVTTSISTTTTTALPSYEQETRRYRERREAAKQQIQRQVEEAKVREREKKERKAKTTPLGALRHKKKEKEKGKEEKKDKEREKDHGNESIPKNGPFSFPVPSVQRGGGVDFGGMI